MDKISGLLFGPPCILFKTCLKMIGKDFVLFKINSSQGAFYIIKPACIWWLVFKVSNYFKKLSDGANVNVCLRCWVMTACQGRMKTSSLFVSAAVLNLIFGTLSAQL